MRLALIGLGMVADTYVDAIADSNGALALLGVFARSEQSRRTFAERASQRTGTPVSTYATLADIAADDRVDGVIIATPPNARTDAIKLFATAGKPILCEKPLERDTLAARQIVEICEAAGTPLAVMLQHRARPVSRIASTRLQSGEFGALAMLRINVPWWRDQTYYDQAGRGTFARDGGGVMISQAIHTMDLALWLAGPVKSVTGQTATTALHSLEAEDWVNATFEMESGANGSLFATTAAYPGAPESIELHCAKAALRLESGTLVIDWHDGCQEIEGEAGGTGSGADPMAFTHAWHQSVLLDFAESVAETRAPMITGRDALQVHAVIDAVALSSREGRRVALEEFSVP